MLMSNDPNSWVQGIMMLVVSSVPGAPLHPLDNTVPGLTVPCGWCPHHPRIQPNLFCHRQPPDQSHVMYERRQNATMQILKCVCREENYLSTKMRDSNFQRGDPLKILKTPTPRPSSTATKPNWYFQRTPNEYRYFVKSWNIQFIREIDANI